MNFNKKNVFKNWKYKLTGIFLLLGSCIFLLFQFLEDKVETFELSYDRLGMPCLTIFVQNQPFRVGLDLGAFPFLNLSEVYLNSLKGNYIQTVETLDAFGKTYTEKEFSVDNISLGSKYYNQVKVRFEKQQELENKTIKIKGGGTDKKQTIENPIKISGYLGRDFLNKINLLLDCANSRLYFIKDFDKATRKQLISKDATKLSFSGGGKEAILINVYTDLGLLPFLLDTGTTYSVVASQCFDTILEQGSFWETSCFSIKEVKHPPRKLIVLNLHSDLPFKGILGMDFFKDHKIFIDWEKQELYID